MGFLKSWRIFMRQAESKKWAMAVGIGAMLALGANLLATVGVTTLPSAIAQEGEKNPEVAEEPADEGAKAPAADANAGSQAQAPQSMLSWFFSALGWRYTIAFLIISFSFVAFLVMNILSARRDSMAPKHLAEAFEAHLNEKKF